MTYCLSRPIVHHDTLYIMIYCRRYTVFRDILYIMTCYTAYRDILHVLCIMIFYMLYIVTYCTWRYTGHHGIIIYVMIYCIWRNVVLRDILFSDIVYTLYIYRDIVCTVIFPTVWSVVYHSLLHRHRKEASIWSPCIYCIPIYCIDCIYLYSMTIYIEENTFK